MPKLKDVETTEEELRDFARRLQDCLDAFTDTADFMKAEKLDYMLLATGTFKSRLEQIEGFVGTLEKRRRAKQNAIREDAVKYKKDVARTKSRKSGNKKN